MMAEWTAACSSLRCNSAGKGKDTNPHAVVWHHSEGRFACIGAGRSSALPIDAETAGESHKRRAGEYKANWEVLQTMDQTKMKCKVRG